MSGYDWLLRYTGKSLSMWKGGEVEKVGKWKGGQCTWEGKKRIWCLVNKEEGGKKGGGGDKDS